MLLLLLPGLPQMYIFLFYCVIPTAKMTLNSVQTAIKHQLLAPRKVKMQRGERNYWKTEGNASAAFTFPPLFKLCVIQCSVVCDGGKLLTT